MAFNRSKNWTGAAALLLFFGAAAVGPAQPGYQKNDRRKQEQPKQRGNDRRDDNRRDDNRGDSRSYAAPQRSEQQARQWQQQRGWARQGGWQGNNSWNQHKARQWKSQHRTWSQRGGYGGYYIPQARFVQSFGSRNYFRIGARPVIVGGYPRFNYGGYQFMMVDPWPDTWGDNWYANEDVYVDYDDGYYLHNRRDPGISIAISVVL